MSDRKTLEFMHMGNTRDTTLWIHVRSGIRTQIRFRGGRYTLDSANPLYDDILLRLLDTNDVIRVGATAEEIGEKRDKITIPSIEKVLVRRTPTSLDVQVGGAAMIMPEDTQGTSITTKTASGKVKDKRRVSTEG